MAFGKGGKMGGGGGATKIGGLKKPPKQGKIKGISTPFSNRIAGIGGKR